MTSNRRADIEALMLDMLDTRHPLSRSVLLNWTTDQARRATTAAVLDQLLADGVTVEHPGNRYTLKE